MPTGSIEQQQSLKNQVFVYFRAVLTDGASQYFATAFINDFQVAEVYGNSLEKVKHLIGYNSMSLHDLYSACFNGEEFTFIIRYL